MTATKPTPFARDERLRAIVAELRAAGFTYAAIADRLGISLTTTRLLTLPPPARCVTVFFTIEGDDDDDQS